MALAFPRPASTFITFPIAAILKELVILNPVESIPVNIFPMLVSNNMKEEIILSNNVPFILAANF